MAGSEGALAAPQASTEGLPQDRSKGGAVQAGKRVRCCVTAYVDLKSSEGMGAEDLCRVSTAVLWVSEVVEIVNSITIGGGACQSCRTR